VKYAVDMALGDMMYTPNFMDMCGSFQNLLGENTQNTQTPRNPHKHTFIF
jgi:hypothetical protein